MIVDPWGTVLCTVPDGEGVALAELDFARLEDVRRRLPVAATPPPVGARRALKQPRRAADFRCDGEGSADRARGRKAGRGVRDRLGRDADRARADAAACSCPTRASAASTRWFWRTTRTYLLEDLQSTNGIKVNGKRVRSTELDHGDEIEIGQTRLIFRRE